MAAPRVAHVASAKILVLELKTIVTRLRFDGASRTAELETITALEAACGARWATLGTVAEAFANAYVAAGNIEKAIAWYERAIAAPDGQASLRAVEQLGNLKVRLAWNSVQAFLGRARSQKFDVGQDRGRPPGGSNVPGVDRPRAIQSDPVGANADR